MKDEIKINYVEDFFWKLNFSREARTERWADKAYICLCIYCTDECERRRTWFQQGFTDSYRRERTETIENIDFNFRLWRKIHACDIHELFCPVPTLVFLASLSHSPCPWYFIPLSSRHFMSLSPVTFYYGLWLIEL